MCSDSLAESVASAAAMKKGAKMHTICDKFCASTAAAMKKGAEMHTICDKFCAST